MKIISPIIDIPHPKPVQESHVCFVSLVPACDGYHAAYREFSPNNDVRSCSARYQKYGYNLELVGDSHLLRTLVEDPRAFLWRGKPYAIALDEVTKGVGIAHFHQVIMDLSTGESFDLKTPLSYQGKNWMPVPDGDRLYFIRSIDPLCILECSERWECTMVIPPNAGEHQIGQYRGGAAATIKDGIINGYGHRTIGLHHHVPYTFQIELATRSVFKEDLTPTGFDAETILDPTSILGEDVVLACSARAWNTVGQLIPTRLCKIESNLEQESE